MSRKCISHSAREFSEKEISNVSIKYCAVLNLILLKTFENFNTSYYLKYNKTIFYYLFRKFYSKRTFKPDFIISYIF